MELNGVWGTPALPQQQKLFLKMRDSDFNAPQFGNR